MGYRINRPVYEVQRYPDSILRVGDAAGYVSDHGQLSYYDRPTVPCSAKSTQRSLNKGQ